MKKRLIGIASLVLALALVVGGCDLFGSDDGSGDGQDFSAPDIGRASDLPATGGTAPADDAAAKALFDGAVEAVGTAMMASQGARSMTAARATQTIPTETISWTGPYAGGTVNVQGTMGGSFTFPDKNFEPIANHTYNDIAIMSMNFDASGTVTGITIIEDQGFTYTITGKLINDLDFDLSIDVTTGATAEGAPTAADMDLSFAQRAGYALSIKRSDGVGAKFLISYAHRFSMQDINILNLFSGSQSPDLGTAITAELTGKTATLQVYDDANNLLSEQTLLMSDITGGLMDMMDMMNMMGGDNS